MTAPKIISNTTVDTNDLPSTNPDIPRGTPVSGRVWKSIADKKSNMVHKSLKKTWEKRLKERQSQGLIKALEKEMKAEKEVEKEREKQVREERRKRKEENEKKAEVVQKISAAKFKRLKKRQLKGIMKR